MVSRPGAPLERPDMRREILTHATRLFAAGGYEGTSLQQIADAVGIRKPSLLHHFASKEQLLQAVLDEVLARWNDTLPKLMLAATAGEGQFDAVTREIVSFFAEDLDRARLLIREALDRPDEMRERLRKHVRPVVVNLASTVGRGQARGQLHAGADPESYLFQTIILLVCGVTFSESFGPLMPRSSERGKPRERLHSELLRIAKSSLFLSPDAPGSFEGPTPKTGVEER
ncbi:MAG: TetR/AcrR family transcriptional regulator [Polyangiaceae bacterium]|nr:TetR/AcrR family transcriptional regulator [Polyangiaceae bacterium]